MSSAIKLSHLTTSRYSDEPSQIIVVSRILSRCFSAEDADRWMLKGVGALLARLPVTRHSKDIGPVVRKL